MTVGNGSAGYPDCKKMRTVLSIQSVHLDPRLQPSRHIDPYSSFPLSILQDPSQTHLSRLSFSPVLVTANFLSLTPPRRPFPVDSQPMRPYRPGLTSFTPHWTH